MRVMNYIKLLDDSDAYVREDAAIHCRHPEFWDKRISNRQRIQEEIEHNKQMKNDLVTVFAHKNCPTCSQFRDIVFSISGNDWRYPKLPDTIINQTHDCTEHTMYLQSYFEELEELDKKYPNELTESEKKELEEIRRKYISEN